MPKLSSHVPLKIAILGAGKIGSTFASQLARVGHHVVTVIARPGSIRLQQLQQEGGILHNNGERALVTVRDSLDEQTPYDLVIVTLLDHQTASVLPALQKSKALCIQCMFNTFRPEHFREAIGADRCAFGMPFVQATLDHDGKLNATIGAAGQKTIMSEQRWADLFNAAGLPAVIETDMPLWLRCHVPMCVAFESVSVAGKRRGNGASWREALVLAHGIHASYQLIRGLGYHVYPSTKRRLDGCPNSVLAAILWSMSRIRAFRELLATGKVECEMLVNDMVIAARCAQKPLEVARIQAMKP